MAKDKILKSLEIDTKKDSISQVIGIMDSLRLHFKKHKEKSFVPFLETYYIVTQNIFDKNVNRKKYFSNEKILEKLDVIFASNYFSPLKKKISGNISKTPWKEYFSYCKKREGKVFLQMLLGINAHINGDLAISLYESKYKSRKDFFKVNRILKESIPEIMDFLAFEEKDFVGFGGIVFRKFFEEYFKKIIVRWRLDAWENYRKMNKNNFRDAEKLIHKKTEEVSRELIKVFDDFYHFRNLGKMRKRLLDLRVRV